MVNGIIKFLGKKNVQHVVVRFMYIINAIESHYLIFGLLSFITFILLAPTSGYLSIWDYVTSLSFGSILAIILLITLFKFSDFFPTMLLFIPLIFFCFTHINNFSLSFAGNLLIINILLFFLFQPINSLPPALALEDFTIPFRMPFKSLTTIAATNMSFLVCIYFSWIFSMVLRFKPDPINDTWALLFFISVAASSVISRFCIPANPSPKNQTKTPSNQLAQRVIYLNIDGCRLDVFNKVNPKYLSKLQEESSYYEKGAMTVYRALTNPAMASIITGVPPEVHGLKHNNTIGKSLIVEALPDLVDSILYGSIHIEHISKKHWNRRILSIPELRLKTDDYLFELLKKDIVHEPNVRFFFADLSLLDLVGSTYGSSSKQYVNQINIIDGLIELFFKWLEKK